MSFKQKLKDDHNNPDQPAKYPQKRQPGQSGEATSATDNQESTAGFYLSTLCLAWPTVKQKCISMYTQIMNATASKRPYQLLLFAGILIVAWSFMFPALNWPDEVYKLEQLHFDQNLYARVMAFLGSDHCIFETKPRGSTYLSNHLHVLASGDLSCYYFYKTINILIYMVLVTASCFLLIKPYIQRCFLLALIWPSVMFYSSSINQQTVFTVLSSFMVAATLTSKRIWPFLILSTLAVAIDRSFVSTTVFLAALMVLKWKPRAGLPMILIIVAASSYILPMLLKHSNFLFELKDNMSVDELKEALTAYQDPIYVSLGLLFISFVYLGGTNTLLGIGIDYLVVLILFVRLVWDKRSNREMWAYIYAIFFTYFLVVSVIPTLQTFRYYTFIMPALIYFLLDSAKLRRIYTAYSLIMSITYLFLANVANV